MSKKINWGIIGCGFVAADIAAELNLLSDAELVAVGSRTEEKAQNFAKRFCVEKYYGSYEELVNDSNVDVVYIATQHPFHMNNALLGINAKKAVLCEKPFAMDYVQADKMRSASIKSNTFLMEAMRPRFLPVMYKIRQIINNGEIGDILSLHADFGFITTQGIDSRLFVKKLGGGALLDVGVYPISLASMIFKQQPDNIISSATMGETNVDYQSSYIFNYANGAIAILSSAITANTRCGVFISGTKGTIELLPPFWRTGAAIVDIFRGNKRTIDIPFEGKGYSFIASEVNDCLRNNKKQSDIMPLTESVEIMKTIDIIKEQIGLQYS